MIDDKKIIGMLQAKALGCLDESDNTEIQAFIDAGYVFPWNELGQYQNTVSLLPLTLQIELPDPGLKDKVALKLIKLSEELKAKKIAEEELSKASESQEIIEEEIDEKPDEFVNLDEPFVEPPIEIETESPVIESDIKFSEPPNIVEPVFNLDDIELPGYEEENVNINLADVSESEITAIETKTENVTDNMVLESEAPSEPINQLDIITCGGGGGAYAGRVRAGSCAGVGADGGAAGAMRGAGRPPSRSRIGRARSPLGRWTECVGGGSGGSA